MLPLSGSRVGRRAAGTPYLRSVTNLLSSSDAAVSTQSEVDAEIAAVAASAVAGEPQPRLDYPPYRSSLLRHPTKDLQPANPEGIELWSPSSASRRSTRSRPT